MDNRNWLFEDLERLEAKNMIRLKKNRSDQGFGDERA